MGEGQLEVGDDLGPLAARDPGSAVRHAEVIELPSSPATQIHDLQTDPSDQHDVCMHTKTRVTVTIPDAVLKAARRDAESGAARSLGAWVNNAAEAKARRESLDHVLDELLEAEEPHLAAGADAAQCFGEAWALPPPPYWDRSARLDARSPAPTGRQPNVG